MCGKAFTVPGRKLLPEHWPVNNNHGRHCELTAWNYNAVMQVVTKERSGVISRGNPVRPGWFRYCPRRNMDSSGLLSRKKVKIPGIFSDSRASFQRGARSILHPPPTMYAGGANTESSFPLCQIPSETVFQPAHPLASINSPQIRIFMYNSHPLHTRP